MEQWKKEETAREKQERSNVTDLAAMANDKIGLWLSENVIDDKIQI